ncbi:type 1 glutamine amidotransferase domain-containing protein [Phanerochaete sordida]|uniref:D-lactate dehydratase n=1 Tax=Phanerochaete sordida TaxID=48140 RepID=A0A9P3FXJ7_9APHY|nr:type 1 glutamine amidotransferase domain-containing protein [Phanerochaete sordida]
MSPRILFVLTSADKSLTGKPTGWYLPEAAHPYYILAPHAEIDFAAPGGANPPLDPGSAENFKADADCTKFLADAAVQQKLATAKRLADVDAKDYDAVFYVGGHGPVIDLASDPVNAALASAFFQAGKVTAAVCHGPAALVQAVDATGASIFKGREATGFSNAEEIAIDQVKAIPFLLEDRINELGGKYVKADAAWAPKVVVDGNLITGQNPASAGPIGQAILKALQK